MRHRHTPLAKERANELSHETIGAAIEVHRRHGPELLENAYQAGLCHELTMRKIPFRPQVPLPLNYKGITLDCTYRMDIAIETDSCSNSRPLSGWNQ